MLCRASAASLESPSPGQRGLWPRQRASDASATSRRARQPAAAQERWRPHARQRCRPAWPLDEHDGQRAVRREITRPDARCAGSGPYEASRRLARRSTVHHTSAALRDPGERRPARARRHERLLLELGSRGRRATTATPTEGADDRPAHIRAALTATSCRSWWWPGDADLGRWQADRSRYGHRARGRERRITLHLARRVSLLAVRPARTPPAAREAAQPERAERVRRIAGSGARTRPKPRVAPEIARQGLEARGQVDRGPDRGEVEPAGAADVAVQHLAEMQRHAIPQLGLAVRSPARRWSR